MQSSRFVRPERPATSLVLTARDYRVFATLRDYGFLFTRHLQALCFPGTHLRQVQRRLRRLWEHELLGRVFRPVIFDGSKPFHLDMAYCLGKRTEGLVVDGNVLPKPKELSTSRFDHEVAVADCLAAITAACRGRPDVTLASATPALPLLRHLHVAARIGMPAATHLIPDGAVVLRYSSGETLTFYIEIVRADVKSGNDTLGHKMQEYVRLNRDGQFRALYGHEQLRAVLFLTTSDERAEHFRQLAAHLPHGRRLFWFGCYEQRSEDGRARSAITPENALDAQWRSSEGELLSFLSL